MATVFGSGIGRAEVEAVAARQDKALPSHGVSPVEGV